MELEEPAMPKGSDEFVEAFARGLAAIRVFGYGTGPLSITEIAERAKLTRAGARRLMLTLVTLKYAVLRDGRFSLTPRVLELGFAYLSSMSLRELAQPVIEALARDTNELCAVSVLDEYDIVYIARAEIRTLLTRSVGIGSRLPAFATSMGRVLLAGLEPVAADALLESSRLVAYTRFTPTSRGALRADLDRVREQGYALVSQELELGVCGLAAPLRDAGGTVVAAINISTNLARHDEAAIVTNFLPRLKYAAKEIEAALRSLNSP